MQTFDPEQSNMVRHARRELEIANVEVEERPGILKIIEDFASIGPSGSQAAWLIQIITALLKQENLSPLTDRPDEWQLVTDGTWQSNRNSEAFSKDAGKTYYLLSEGGSDVHPEPLHKTFWVGD